MSAANYTDSFGVCVCVGMWIVVQRAACTCLCGLDGGIEVRLLIERGGRGGEREGG